MTPEGRIAAAIELLDEIESVIQVGHGPPADRVAQGYFRSRRYIGAKDRADIHARVYRLLRRRGALGWRIDHLGLRRTGRALILAQLTQEDGISGRALDALFTDARHGPGRLGQADRALLEGLRATPPPPDWARLEHPQALTPALTAALGEQYEAEMKALAEPANVVLRVNTLKASVDEAAARLAEEGIAATPCAHAPFGLTVEGRPNIAGGATFRDGWVELQDEASQIAALLCDPAPGQAVLDLCAGAGGKALAFAARMENRGRLVACDVDAGRLEAGARRRRRAGVDCLTTRQIGAEGDAWLKRQAGKYDRVFVDAPCTGTGAWRRNPDQRWRLDDGAPERLAALQDSLLDRAAALVKPGGRLIYATCSILPIENADRVAAFRVLRPDFAALDARTVWAARTDHPAPAGLAADFRALPGRDGMDGFYCALLERPLNEGAP